MDASNTASVWQEELLALHEEKIQKRWTYLIWICFIQRMPYDRLNSRLPQRLEVITYDMDLDPDQGEFVPVGYDESWQRLLEECFKDLLSFPS